MSFQADGGISGLEYIYSLLEDKKVHPETGHEVPEGDKGVYLYSYFNLGIIWGWLSPLPRRFTPPPRGKRPGTHCTGGGVGPRAGLEGLRKLSPARVFVPQGLPSPLRLAVPTELSRPVW